MGGDFDAREPISGIVFTSSGKTPVHVEPDPAGWLQLAIEFSETGYTARVRALNGAGWSSYSPASQQFTPIRPVTA
jgi:hypothetical protein